MRKHAGKALLALIVVLLITGACFAEELYPGENTLAEAARKEKGLNSYDTGPTWANWQALFDGFEKRYGIQITWNDLGSGSVELAARGDGVYARFSPQAAAVPEPSSMLLLALTAAAAGARVMTRRRGRTSNVETAA